ncbi:hypothetical protein AnigIFM63309_008399 [Aspergillus niger]|nr:hypothetical protein AnigIFM63309_008399 [Aspergillus niger]
MAAIGINDSPSVLNHANHRDSSQYGHHPILQSNLRLGQDPRKQGKNVLASSAAKDIDALGRANFLRIFKCLWDISSPSTLQMKRSSTSSVISSYWELQKATTNLSGMVAYCALEHACVRELIPVMQDPAYGQQAHYSEQWTHRTPPKATEDDLYGQGTGHL